MLSHIHRLTVTALLLALALPAMATAQADGGTDDDAVQAASAWLAVVDGAEYAQSWREAASLLRSSVSRDHWVRLVSGTREQAGAFRTRDLSATAAAAAPAGLPAGDYLRVRFRSRFEHPRDDVFEDVTVTREGDAWRVVGYAVVPLGAP